MKLEREPAAGGPPEVVVGGEGSLGYSGWSLAKTGAVAYAYTTPASPAQLYVASGTRLAAATHASRPGRARRQADRASRAAGVQDPRRTLGGGVPDPSAEPGRHARAPLRTPGGERSRGPARRAGSGVQLHQPDLCRPRFRHADGQLPWFDRLRAGVRRQDPERPGWRRNARRAGRGRCGTRQVLVARSQPAWVSRAPATVDRSPTSSPP